MSLLGIDIGTTGCKSTLFSENGAVLGSMYMEYDHVSPQPGWAELNSLEVWEKTKRAILAVAEESSSDPISALAVSSLGEAMVPVSKNREILGNSILNYCIRGTEFADELISKFPSYYFYTITGLTFGSHYSLSKLLWIKKYQPKLYEAADFFLPWTSFISFMLGADPFVDYSLAARTMLFDINQETWSEEIINAVGLDRTKLPKHCKAAKCIGKISNKIANELNLPVNTPIIIGAIDQCANAVGCGVIRPGQSMLGMGSFTCAVPIFNERADPALLIPLGVNTQHHAIPDTYVSFIYNQGGSIIKWFRDTFASTEKLSCIEEQKDIYNLLFSEVPSSPGQLLFLPYLSTTGLPEMSTETAGVILGLHLTTTRGEILRSIVESIIFDLKRTFSSMEKVGLNIDEFIAAGGGSKSDAWLQICADIMNCSIRRTPILESGTLGSAIIAGVGIGSYGNFLDAVSAMVKLSDRFDPKPSNLNSYNKLYEKFITLRGTLTAFLKDYSQSFGKN